MNPGIHLNCASVRVVRGALTVVLPASLKRPAAQRVDLVRHSACNRVGDPPSKTVIDKMPSGQASGLQVLSTGGTYSGDRASTLRLRETASGPKGPCALRRYGGGRMIDSCAGQRRALWGLFVLQVRRRLVLAPARWHNSSLQRTVTHSCVARGLVVAVDGEPARRFGRAAAA